VRTWRHDRYRAHPTVPGRSAGRGTGNNTVLPQQIRRAGARVDPGRDARASGRPHGRDRFRMGRVEVAEDDRAVSTAQQQPGTVASVTGAGRALRGDLRLGRPSNARRVTENFHVARHAQPPGLHRGGGRHRAHPGRRRPMTALTIAAAVIIVAAGAIIQFRTAAVTTESAGGGADAFPWPGTPPVDWEDPMAARAPSSAGPVAPFQIRPAAVQADSPEENQPASTSGISAGPDQGTPPTPAPMSPASAAPTDTATEPAERPLPSADQSVRPAVVGAAEAPPQEPAAPAPVPAAQTPPPPAPAPDPAPAPPPRPTTDPAPTSQPTTAAPPSPTTAPAPDPAPAPQPTTAPPTTAPESAPPRGKSADHRPEHANGGVGNTDRPKPSHPGSGPKD
jgi:hypothetical protein